MSDDLQVRNQEKEVAYDRGFRDGVAAVRQRERKADPLVAAGPVTFDRGRHEVRVYGEVARMGPGAMAILEAIIVADGHVVASDTLLARMPRLDANKDPGEIVVRVQVCNLRNALARHGLPRKFIQNMRSCGYRINHAALQKGHN